LLYKGAAADDPAPVVVAASANVKKTFEKIKLNNKKERERVIDLLLKVQQVVEFVMHGLMRLCIT
jgi:hypothetical protein